MKTHSVRIDLDAFAVNRERGFLPAEDPLQRLPAAFNAWEELAHDLPKLLVTDRVRHFIDRLPPFPTERLTGDRATRRAMLLLSYLGHGYIWGEREPAHRLPAVLAVPWHAVATRLGRPPVLSYASYALDNWRRIDPDGPVACGNIALIQNFLGGADEEWFILIHVEIEQRAARAIRAAASIVEATAGEDDLSLTSGLREMEASLADMYATLTRMPEHCLPYVYYQRVRPYIHGWKNHPALPEGVVYEGVQEFAGVPQRFRGETGAQSAIIPSLDAALGVWHRDDPLKEYLLEMRDYMPPRHRAFIGALEHSSTVRPYLQSRVKELCDAVEAYNACVTRIGRFRALHLEYAASYIHKQSLDSEANPTDIGTGGTPFMKYLGKHRDETDEHLLKFSSGR
jgi:indoleamine 2,3-dioxygenase